jgi:hypothetical protein
VAFLPTERATHIAAIAAKIVAAGAVGAIWVRFGRPAGPQQLVAQLQQVPIAELDAVVPQAALELQGLVFTRGEASYVEEKLLLGARLYFARGRERVHVGFAKAALSSQPFQRLARIWQGRG